MKPLWSLVMVGTWLMPAGAGAQPAYEREGRRDPFVAPGSLDASKRACPAHGLEAARVREVALRGIVRTPAGGVALLSTAEGTGLFAREGDRLCDGCVVTVGPAGVTLRLDAEPAATADTRQDVRLDLYP